MDVNEQARLKALKDYNILDTLPEEELDALVKLASEICQTPIAFIGLIDDKRQWYKAARGLTVSEYPRNITFCQHTIQQNELFEVRDAASHKLFSSNPFVTGETQVRFYAGVPLTSPEGYNLGTLCVVDTERKALSDNQKASLKTLSKFVMNNFELRKTRSEMQASRQYYQELVEKAADIIYTCNTKGELTFVSAAVESITGYRSSELIGKHFTEMVSLEHKRRVNLFYLLQFKNSTVETRLEFPMLTASGEKKWIEQTVVLSLRDGVPSGFQGVVRDISERKKIEEQLIQANQRFEKIFSHSSVPMTLASGQPSRFINVNKSFKRMTGYTLDELKGFNSAQVGLLPDSERKKITTILERDGFVWNYETRILTRDNKEKWVLMSIEPIESGGENFMLGVYVNISMRKKREQELIKTKDLLAETMSIGRMGSYENNIKTGKTSWSREMFEIMDMDPWAEPINMQDFLKVLEPEGRAAATQRIQNAIQNFQPYNTINRIRTAGGRVKWVELRAVPVGDAEGKLEMFRGTMQDITESKELQQELLRAKEMAEESGKAKELFLANMSHEIRTPMNAALGFADLLSETKLDKKQHEYVQAIETSGRSLMAVINDILDYSKIEAGMLTIDKVPLNIKNLFASLSISLTEQAKKKHLLLDFSVDKKIPDSLCGDPVRLSQILINLVGNAIKFTSKGSIKVKASLLEKNESQAKIAFTIKDTGIGIPQDQLQSVFERFNQGSNEITRKFGGTGLGLSIVKKLAELQGGSVSLNSVVKKGSEFVVMIPYAIEVLENATADDPVVQADTAAARSASILLVEDNKLNQKLAEKILQDFGFMVGIADNGKVAIEKLKKKRFDLVLMDMQMPEMDGYEATEVIRKKMKNDVPIIALTAHAMASEREKCLQLGMNDYISKPFKKEDLYRTIMATIGKGQPTKREIVLKTKTKGKGKRVLNLDYLKGLAGGNQKFVQEVLEIFVREIPLELKRLEKAFERADYHSIEAGAHKLKSSIGFVGLSKMTSLLSEMEQQASNKKQLEKGKKLLEELRTVCVQAVKEAEQSIL